MQAAGYITVKEVTGKEANGAPDYYEVTATAKLSPFAVVSSEDAENINAQIG